MALITLKDMGKIYVSGNNVAVGIRGVNLSFDRGEFVAITGESGSGKSTLLNVISGMDTYEEGELLIEGEPTSHYVQADWEEYRLKYISFIFQDYNIIESFTVLQNVELALMHIKNPKQRRERAVELLRRVGLEEHLHHKGSKLSGGQKQRTVIARALAKDSPIILADEPTGNLDSQTSREIIELLREVSKDKLVIVVTHNFEQVEACATRHVRVFDGAIEADQRIAPPAVVETAAEKPEQEVLPSAPKPKKKGQLRDGLLLGRARFGAMPKLSTFLCVLMILSSLAITFVTSKNGGAVLELFDKNYIFTHEAGRVVLLRQDGAVITDEELDALAQTTGAVSTLHYDFLLDTPQDVTIGDDTYKFAFSYDAFDGIDAGRAPQTESEVLLRVPVALRDSLGGGDFTETVLPNIFGLVNYTVVGVDYYRDNTRTPEMIFTKSGYETASALAYFANSKANFTAETAIRDNQKTPETLTSAVKGDSMHVSFDIGAGAYYIADAQYQQNLKHFADIKQAGKIKNYDYSVGTTLSGTFVDYDYSGQNGYYYTGEYAVDTQAGYGTNQKVSSKLEDYTQLASIDDNLSKEMSYEGWNMLLSPDVLVDFMTQHYYTQTYTQASLFFTDDTQANAKAAELENQGYTAVASDAVSKDTGAQAIMRLMSLLLKAFGWVITVIFIALFLSLCSTRSMLATRGDIAILRSMGISTPVIKTSIYVQTLMALLPAYAVTALAAVAVFSIPKTNAVFTFLHGWQYAAIAAALLVIDLLLSRRYVKKMFSSSVKKTLKGGAEG